MNRVLHTLILFAWAVVLCAIPAKRVKKTIVVDGRNVEVTLTGNERLHYWLADDGTAYELQSDGSYAAFDLVEAKGALGRMRKMNNVPAPGRVPPRRTATHVDPIIGKKKGLVLLVETSDLKFTCSDDPQALFHDMMNKEGFDYGTANGSVRDYFRDQSFGKLDYEFDVVGPYTVSHEMAYYGGNTQFEYEAVAVCDMVREAVLLANNDVDFSQYDLNGDGEVENIYVIYPGYAEAHGAPEWTIWPHAWRISYANWWVSYLKAPVCDGVRVDSYACSSEYRGTRGKKIDGIGTIVHEFSHCLGLPDWYNTQNTDYYTNAYWSVLDTGAYSDNGDTPTAYTAYERWFCGWMEPEELTDDTEVKGLTDIDESHKAYIYYNEGNRNEFYILHNIQQRGWNKYAYARGLAIFHVDLNDYAWENDEVNNDPSHQRMQLICADNKYTYDSVWYDLYPNLMGNRWLNDVSTPSCTVFNKNIDGTYSMGKYLNDIWQTSSGEISFNFKLSESLKNAAAISEVSASAATDQDVFYNLSGQRVGADYKGVVITPAGKKMLRR